MKRAYVEEIWREMTTEDREKRTKELIRSCMEDPRVTGRDYAELEEEYFALRQKCMVLLMENHNLKLLNKSLMFVVRCQRVLHADGVLTTPKRDFLCGE